MALLTWVACCVAWVWVPLAVAGAVPFFLRQVLEVLLKKYPFSLRAGFVLCEGVRVGVQVDLFRKHCRRIFNFSSGLRALLDLFLFRYLHRIYRSHWVEVKIDHNLPNFHGFLLIGCIKANGVTMSPSSGIVIPSRALMFQYSISALMIVPFVMAIPSPLRGLRV